VTRAVFFDAGHTLLYPHPDIGSVYAEATARHGVTLPAERYAAALEPVFKEAAKRYQATLHASDEQDFALWRDVTRRLYDLLPELASLPFDPWFESLYRRFGDPALWRFYDDVESTLKSLRARGLKIVVVSNWDTRLRGICGGLGLDRLVDSVVISAEVGFRKPNPEIFRVALEKAGVRPEEAIHVGDLPEEDGEGARRAGIRAVIINRRKSSSVVAADHGLPLIRSLAELEGHL
jgi:putative hydrolase of the HAD superfamily